MGTYQFRLPSSKEVFLFGITGGVVGATLLHMMLMVPKDTGNTDYSLHRRTAAFLGFSKIPDTLHVI